MPDKSPIAPIALDPRNQGEIVLAATQEVLNASDGLLNDFSSGSPLLVLIEGQAFTQAEFLFWLNQLPDAFLATWMQHYLGIERLLGAKASVNLLFTLSKPLPREFRVFQNFRVRSISSVNDNTISFVTDQELIIPAGSITGTVTATCEFLGVDGNVGSNQVTVLETPLAFLQSVTNPDPATGGRDAESIFETKSRALYHTASYRNPVSHQDWVSLIQNYLGTSTTVISEYDRLSYTYYFYVLSETGNPFSEAQLSNLRTSLLKRLSLGLDLVVKNFLYQDIDVYLEITDPNNVVSNPYDYLNFLANIAFKVNFKFTYENAVQGLDIASIFAQEFSYLNPNLEKIQLFSTPPALLPQVDRQFISGAKYQIGDLILVGSQYYEVLEDFDPIGSTFLDYVSIPSAVDKVDILEFVPNSNYLADRVVKDGGNYYKVPYNGYFTSTSALIPLTVNNSPITLNIGELILDPNYPSILGYIPKLPIDTQDNLSTILDCLNANVIAPVIVVNGTPTNASGLVIYNSTVYRNLNPASVKFFESGYFYQARFKAGNTYSDSQNNLFYCYKDNELMPLSIAPNGSITMVDETDYQRFIDDRGNIYKVLLSCTNIDDVFLAEEAGYFIKDNVLYPVETTVEKIGVQYSYRLRRATVKVNGGYYSSLYGINSFSNNFVDYSRYI